MKKEYYSLTIGWLYPDLMNIYGDRGNILILAARGKQRGITINITPLSIGSTVSRLRSCDMLFMGGAQDKQQEIVQKDLAKKHQALRKIIEGGVPGLYVCGAYQLLGSYYLTVEGKIPGLEIFPVYTQAPDPRETRLVGGMAINCTLPLSDQIILGFENHNGRTYLENDAKPFGTVLAGHGNNDSDNNEGIIYYNSIGTYLHGPILSANPQLTDWLLAEALRHKYDHDFPLESLNDQLEEQARTQISKQLKIT